MRRQCARGFLYYWISWRSGDTPRIEVVECDPEQSAFHCYSWHIGDYERKLQSRGLVQFMPTLLRHLPDLYRNHIRVDVDLHILQFFFPSGHA